MNELIAGLLIIAIILAIFGVVVFICRSNRNNSTW